MDYRFCFFSPTSGCFSYVTLAAFARLSVSAQGRHELTTQDVISLRCLRAVPVQSCEMFDCSLRSYGVLEPFRDLTSGKVPIPDFSGTEDDPRL